MCLFGLGVLFDSRLLCFVAFNYLFQTKIDVAINVCLCAMLCLCECMFALFDVRCDGCCIVCGS